MGLVKWSDRLRCGVRAMDSEHEELFSLLVEIEQMVSQSNRKSALEGVSRLIFLLRRHYSSEEYLLKSNNYPGVSKQIKDHEELMAKFCDISKKLESGSLELNVGLVEQMAAMLNDHIMGADQAYGEFLNSVGVK